VWDAATGKSLVEFKGHSDGVKSAALSPDGMRVVTASYDGTVRVWDAATGQSLVVLEASADFAKFSPDGTQIVAASANGAFRVWDSVPYRERFPAIQRARAAEAKMEPIVSSRLEAGESADTLLVAFANDPAITPEERSAAQAALFARVAEQHAEAQARLYEARTLNSAAWNAVRFASVTREAAVKALAEARRAVELEPGQESFLTTLGVALYRTGEYKEALNTLIRSDAINAKGKVGPRPGDIAFIAMAHWQLGHKDEALTKLATLRDLAADDRWKADEETIRHWAEAVALMSEKP
jgi:hypothetical protein